MYGVDAAKNSIGLWVNTGNRWEWLPVVAVMMTRILQVYSLTLQLVVAAISFSWACAWIFFFNHSPSHSDNASAFPGSLLICSTSSINKLTVAIVFLKRWQIQKLDLVCSYLNGNSSDEITEYQMRHQKDFHHFLIFEDLQLKIEAWQSQCHTNHCTILFPRTVTEALRFI